jgi:hypothetical protein
LTENDAARHAGASPDVFDQHEPASEQPAEVGAVVAPTAAHDTDQRRPLTADPGDGGLGPLLWQRTDTVGTELVFQSGTDPRTACGSAVVAGPLPHTTRWHAEANADSVVRALTVTCDGAGWSRTLRLARDTDGTWTCDGEATGDLQAPLPGLDEPGRLHPAAIVRLSDSPMFVTWALRRLRLTPGDQPVAVPTVRVLTPSLVVLPGISTYQLVSERRLRISGDEPASGYDLDRAGIVTYQPARMRLAR